MSNTMICDFCSSTNVVHSFPSKAFTLQIFNIISGSDGAWASCPVCKVLIDTEEWEKLYIRSLETFREQSDPIVPKAVAEAFIRKLHAEFRYHRTVLKQ